MTNDHDVSVEDDLAARRLIARYAHLVDNRDYKAAAQLFEADGRVVFEGEEFKGRDAVASWFEKVVSPLGATQHQTTNIVVTYGSKPDTLHAIADLMLLAKVKDAWTPMIGARYHDTFVGHGRQIAFRQRILRVS